MNFLSVTEVVWLYLLCHLLQNLWKDLERWVRPVFFFLALLVYLPLTWSLLNLGMLNTGYVNQRQMLSAVAILICYVTSQQPGFCCLHTFIYTKFHILFTWLISRCDYYWLVSKPQLCVAEEMKHLTGTQKTYALLMAQFLLLLQCL